MNWSSSKVKRDSSHGYCKTFHISYYKIMKLTLCILRRYNAVYHFYTMIMVYDDGLVTFYVTPNISIVDPTSNFS